jgi:hypothetical protein
MKCSVKRNPTITLVLDEQEAMILAKIMGNVGGDHDWRSFTGELYDSLLQCLDYDEYCEYTEGVVKQDMMLER